MLNVVSLCNKLALNLVVESYKRCPSTPEKPWQMIVYSDEVDAGDPVAPRGHTRKLWSIYFSFVECGNTI